MRVPTVEAAGACRAVFVSPHVHDVPLACTVRLAAEQAHGRVLVVVAFGGVSETSGWQAWLEHSGVDWLALNLPTAAERGGSAGLMAGEPSADLQATLLGRLETLLRTTRPSDLYLPMGIGGHADHLLVHAAGLEAASLLEAANLFFYEERPAAFLPGATRARVAAVGARLPPAARLPRSASLWRAGLQSVVAPYLGCEAQSRRERLKGLKALRVAWRAMRSWNPQRSLGLRLQPVIEPLGGAQRGAADEAWRLWLISSLAEGWSAQRTAPSARSYGADFAPQAESERYWLRLPERVQDPTLREMV